MQTNIQISITAEVEGIRFGYWNDTADNFIEVDPADSDSLGAASKSLGCSVELVEAIATSLNTLSEAIHRDFLDIWNRLDEMEKRIK